MEVLEVALEHLVALSHLLARLRYAWSMPRTCGLPSVLTSVTLCEEVPLKSIGRVLVEALVHGELVFLMILIVSRVAPSVRLWVLPLS